MSNNPTNIDKGGDDDLENGPKKENLPVRKTEIRPSLERLSLTAKEHLWNWMKESNHLVSHKFVK